MNSGKPFIEATGFLKHRFRLTQLLKPSGRSPANSLTEQLRIEFSRQWRTFLHAMLAAFLLMDIVAVTLWLSNAGSLIETIWGGQVVFLVPFVITLLGAVAGSLPKKTKELLQLKATLMTYVISGVLSISFVIALLIISHWSNYWMDIFVELYWAVPYLLAIPLAHLFSFTIAHKTRSVRTAMIFSGLSICLPVILFGSAVLLKHSWMLSSQVWLRSAEILESFWVQTIRISSVPAGCRGRYHSCHITCV